MEKKIFFSDVEILSKDLILLVTFVSYNNPLHQPPLPHHQPPYHPHSKIWCSYLCFGVHILSPSFNRQILPDVEILSKMEFCLYSLENYNSPGE